MDSYPYQTIVVDLVKCIANAMGEQLTRFDSTIETRLPTVNHASINRHFSWLAQETKRGELRHLIDGDLSSLTHGLRLKPELIESKNSFAKYTFGRYPLSLSDGIQAQFVQHKPTRISRLIDASLIRSWLEHSDSTSKSSAFFVDSPFSVLVDFLTIPNLASSHAYAVFAVRNYILEVNEVSSLQSTIENSKLRSSELITDRDIDVALSTLWTYIRPRPGSGIDNLNARSHEKAVTAVRQFLSMTRILRLRFSDIHSAQDYLSNVKILKPSSDYEYRVNNDLKMIPQIGEISNQILGLPIPIQGAHSIFEGGIRNSSRGGVVISVNGPPGAGKTSYALATAATLAPMGINCLYITSEENQLDLETRIRSLVPDEISKLFDYDFGWLNVCRIEDFKGQNPRAEEDEKTVIEMLINDISLLIEAKTSLDDLNELGIHSPCQSIVVLDGIHELFMDSDGLKTSAGNGRNLIQLFLHSLVEHCRKLQAMVVITAGKDWEGEYMLDYLVDMVIKLNCNLKEGLESTSIRSFSLHKSRHQSACIGIHGFELSGPSGLRLSPLMTSTVDDLSIWKTKLPDKKFFKDFFNRTSTIPDNPHPSIGLLTGKDFDRLNYLNIYKGANILIYGSGSAGKASFGLLTSISPSYTLDKFNKKVIVARREKVLVISFLYPEEYYLNIKVELEKIIKAQINDDLKYQELNFRDVAAIVKVIQLYPGFLEPHVLFNKIMWEIDSGRLAGSPYTGVLIDGIHNVYLQFPLLEETGIFWPMLFNALQKLGLSIVTTHTTLIVQEADYDRDVDSGRSVPLRHALVQKTDFLIKLDRVVQDSEAQLHSSDLFTVHTLSAIEQDVPEKPLYWSRKNKVLYRSQYSDQQEISFGIS